MGVTVIPVLQLLVGGVDVAQWQGLSDGDLVYVDVTWPSDAGAPPDLCRDLGMGDAVAPGPLHLGALPGDNHTVVQLDPGEPSDFPLNLASCEYDAGVDGMVVLRVRGFYTVLSSSIPTARLVRLRSVEVPLTVARRAVRRAQRR